jgi:hypothetical protein
MESVEDMEEDSWNNPFKKECIAAGLTEVPTKNSPFGVALRKGCVDIVAYLAEACYLEKIKQPLVNVAWMNSMKSKYHINGPPNLTKWKEYAAHPLVDINYRGYLGRTLLMKAISDYNYDPYTEALLTFPSINIELKDDSGKNARQLSCHGDKGATYLRNYLKAKRAQQTKELKGLTELCLFAKVPIPHDLQRIVGEYLIEYRASDMEGDPFPRVCVTTPSAFISRKEEESKEEEEESKEEEEEEEDAVNELEENEELYEEENSQEPDLFDVV